MDKTKLKKEAEHLIKDLPEDAEWDDLMYKIYVRQSIEQGLKDIEEGRVIPHDEIKKNIYWLNENRLDGESRKTTRPDI